MISAERQRMMEVVARVATRREAAPSRPTPAAAWQTVEPVLEFLAARADEFPSKERPSRTIIITLDMCRKARFARNLMKMSGGPSG